MLRERFFLVSLRVHCTLPWCTRAVWEGQGYHRVLRELVFREGFLCSVSRFEMCQFVAEST